MLRPRSALLALPALLAGCSPFNPNLMAKIDPMTTSYSVEGAVTRGFASRPRVAYILAEGDVPDQSSFRTLGSGAGITTQGVYTPTGMIPLNPDGRFSSKFASTHKYALIRLFAWDDINGNGVRDINESLSATEYNLKKESTLGWSYNAPDWNQFNFTFSR